MEDLSLYLHIPFCVRRCGYCDFNTFAGWDHLIPRYIDALQKEVVFYGTRSRNLGKSAKRLETIYFGGGTPSLLSPSHFETILGTISQHFGVDQDTEITIEANPGELTIGLLSSLKDLGINRISLGVQSTDPVELDALDRLHGFPEAVEAVEASRKAGIDNLSLDMIYGIPLQTKKSWAKSLQDILGLAPEHLSLYALTVEKGTLLAQKVDEGRVSVPDDDMAAELFELAENLLDQNGFVHYEISNWAKISASHVFFSRHNRQYWLNQPYLGLGAGAHGFFRKTRYENISPLVGYIRSMDRPEDEDRLFSQAVQGETAIDRFREMQETMMMGLRLLQEGVTTERFSKRFGVDMQDIFGQEIEGFVEKGLVEWVDNPEKSLRLTKRGSLLGNQVFSAFV